jgi:hypothetical protein
MSDHAFEYEGYEELEQFIEKFPEMVLDAAESAMKGALAILRDLPEYPPQPGPDAPAPVWTEKSRRYFFWAVKNNKIPGWRWKDGHPEGQYQRTGHLGRNFTDEVTRSADEVIGTVGTAVPYAAWVVGPDYPGEQIGDDVMYQARIHRNRWWQFYDEIEGNLPAAWEEFDEILFQEIEAQFQEE